MFFFVVFLMFFFVVFLMFFDVFFVVFDFLVRDNRGLVHRGHLASQPSYGILGIPMF